MPLKVVELDEEHEKLFWDHVWKDKIEHYFAILDWKEERDVTKIFLALDRNRIDGLLVLYKDFVASAKGSAGAVEAFMDLDLAGREVVVPLVHKDVLLRRYSSDMVLEMSLLHMKRGQHRPFQGQMPVRLVKADVNDIVELLRGAGPEIWSERALSTVVDNMDKRIWRGIKVDGKLASVGMAHLADFAGIVHTIATAKEHRGRGYAKSIVSDLAGELLKGTEDAMIFVHTQNTPAYKAYTGVGFRPYNQYLSMKAAVRK